MKEAGFALPQDVSYLKHPKVRPKTWWCFSGVFFFDFGSYYLALFFFFFFFPGQQILEKA